MPVNDFTAVHVRTTDVSHQNSVSLLRFRGQVVREKNCTPNLNIT